jgi:hypothetical protein
MLTVLLVLAVFLASAWSLRIGERALLWPQTGRVAAPGATRVVLSYGSAQLEIWSAPSHADREPRAFVLRFYGNADRAEARP